MSEQQQKLDVYSYAQSKGAQYTIGIMGTEWIARCVNPQCSSRNDAFSVQPEGKRTGRWADYGAWMCRKCWDPSEMVPVEYGPERGTRRKRGWGTIIDMVKLCEGMNYKEAKRFILEYEGVAVPLEDRPVLRPPKTDEEWFKETTEYIRLAQRFNEDTKAIVVNYLQTRGITVEIAMKLGYGYSVDPVKIGDTWQHLPFLVIPWYKDRGQGSLYRKLNRRYLCDLPEGEKKYKLRSGSTHDPLYLGECLLQTKRPTFLVESELDAATILQEAGDLVNVVATGSVDHGKNAVNEARLRRQPFVFVSFDDDESGKKASVYWLSKLDSSKSIRYKPLMHDANEMHTTKGLSVRAWVEAGLTYFTPSPVPAVAPEPSLSPIPIHPDLSAQAFYDAFCSRPGYHLRLRDDGLIGIIAPVTDEEYENIVTEVCAQGEALLQVLRECPNVPTSAVVETDEAASSIPVYEMPHADYLAMIQKEVLEQRRQELRTSLKSCSPVSLPPHPRKQARLIAERHRKEAVVQAERARQKAALFAQLKADTGRRVKEERERDEAAGTKKCLDHWYTLAVPGSDYCERCIAFQGARTLDEIAAELVALRESRTEPMLIPEIQTIEERLAKEPKSYQIEQTKSQTDAQEVIESLLGEIQAKYRKTARHGISTQMWVAPGTGYEQYELITYSDYRTRIAKIVKSEDEKRINAAIDAMKRSLYGRDVAD